VTRWVVHVDMDAFYASVEVREDPSLVGRPVVVGGTGGRGVVASASYEARAYGVRSAMPVAQARRLCPHAVFLPPRFELYREASAQLQEILAEVTPIVEPIALDEAFLDVSGATGLFGAPEAIGARIRRKVADALHLAASVGAGPNKLVAKLASKAAKPSSDRSGVRPGPGVVVVAEEGVLEFLWPLPASSLWGVGPATMQRLARLGAQRVADVARLPEDALVSALGKVAGHLVHELAWGRDERRVAPQRAPKSLGHEETYESDVTDRAFLDKRLVSMADQVAGRLRAAGLVARTVTLKLRYGDFQTLTRSHSFAGTVSSGPAILGAARALLAQLGLGNGVRLLGVSASGLVPKQAAPGEQLRLELSCAPAWDRAMEAVDEVRGRFGYGAVRPAGAELGRR
jgi:DNA polymerase-4